MLTLPTRFPDERNWIRIGRLSTEIIQRYRAEGNKPNPTVALLLKRFQSLIVPLTVTPPVPAVKLSRNCPIPGIIASCVNTRQGYIAFGCDG